MNMSAIVQGYRDPASGQQCAWACGGSHCAVPGCTFPDTRCFCVRRERGFPPEPAAPPGRIWRTDYDRGAHDYTDAGCRILAEHAFRDIPRLLDALSTEAALQRPTPEHADDCYAWIAGDCTCPVACPPPESSL